MIKLLTIAIFYFAVIGLFTCVVFTIYVTKAFIEAYRQHKELERKLAKPEETCYNINRTSTQEENNVRTVRTNAKTKT